MTEVSSIHLSLTRDAKSYGFVGDSEESLSSLSDLKLCVRVNGGCQPPGNDIFIIIKYTFYLLNV